MFVTDTHALVWYIDGDHSRISDKARDIFDKTETAETLVYISTAVLWEIAILEKIGRVRLRSRFDEWSKGVLSIKGFELVPITIDIIHRGAGYGLHSDPFDNIIVATAAEMGLPLITKDLAITESNLVEICW
jgi:PIN domain nuclease of toxin-antitoxin system